MPLAFWCWCWNPDLYFELHVTPTLWDLATSVTIPVAIRVRVSFSLQRMLFKHRIHAQKNWQTAGNRTLCFSEGCLFQAAHWMISCPEDSRNWSCRTRTETSPNLRCEMLHNTWATSTANDTGQQGNSAWPPVACLFPNLGCAQQRDPHLPSPGTLLIIVYGGIVQFTNYLEKPFIWTRIM